MARLRTFSSVVSYAINARTEGMEVRAAGQTFGNLPCHHSALGKRLSAQAKSWSPPAQAGSDVTVEGVEIYTRVGKNLPPQSVTGMDNSLH